ncbi:hypothetical protein LCGC14_3071590, partial [marine sediment metagenome]
MPLINKQDFNIYQDSWDVSPNLFLTREGVNGKGLSLMLDCVETEWTFYYKDDLIDFNCTYGQSKDFLKKIKVITIKKLLDQIWRFSVSHDWRNYIFGKKRSNYKLSTCEMKFRQMNYITKNNLSHII